VVTPLLNGGGRGRHVGFEKEADKAVDLGEADDDDDEAPRARLSGVGQGCAMAMRQSWFAVIVVLGDDIVFWHFAVLGRMGRKALMRFCTSFLLVSSVLGSSVFRCVCACGWFEGGVAVSVSSSVDSAVSSEGEFMGGGGW
jgi:hypothetical protein